MASSAPRRDLSDLQRDVLREFFTRERSFFLTGGGALVGFHLHHRETTDLDLFTVDREAFERSRHVLPAVAEVLGSSLEVRQDAPGFRRYALIRGDDLLVVELVHERVEQCCPDKEERDGVIVDPAREILANKLTTLVGRQEVRDVVDVMFLERTGLRVEDSLDAALRKDGGCTPATIAWLLSELRISDDVTLPAGVAPSELRAYVDELVVRLRRLAAPADRGAS